MSSGIAAIILWYPVDEDISLWEHLLVADPIEKLPNLKHEILEDLDGKKLYLFLCQMIKRNIDSDHVICQKDIKYMYIVVNYEEKYTWFDKEIQYLLKHEIALFSERDSLEVGTPFLLLVTRGLVTEYPTQWAGNSKRSVAHRDARVTNETRASTFWNRKESIPKK